VAKDFFDIDVAMDILDMNEEVGRTGKKEHVVFLIVQNAHRKIRRAKPRLQDNEDTQRDQEVLSLLRLQKARSPTPLEELPVLEHCMQTMTGTSHSGELRQGFLILALLTCGPENSLS
jgi:hypothetical protein